MNETEILSLVAEGENERLDRKRELSLTSAREKAELVKDILSLANSALGVGYLLVGVEDDGFIRGITTLDEPQIQQLIRTYVTPPVTVRCQLVPLNLPTLPTVGLIEVIGTQRPHKVARMLEQIQQDDVFVRRGSVVGKASPEEIIQMASRMRTRDRREVIRNAEAHSRVGNWRDAIAIYSRLIREAPSAELFLARAEVYRSYSEHARKPLRITSDDEWQNPEGEHMLRLKAHTDYSGAVSLSDSRDTEWRARMGRLRLSEYPGNPNEPPSEGDWELLQGDVDWLKAHTARGEAYGEILYLQADWGYGVAGRAGLGHEAVTLLDEALGVGYCRPEVYFLRAAAQASVYNFGLALEDINGAITKCPTGDVRAGNYLWFKAEILIEMGKVREARQALLDAHKQGALKKPGFCSLTKYDFREKLLCRYALAHEFGEKEDKVGVYAMLAVVALSQGEKGLTLLSREYPTLVQSLREILGPELGSVLTSDDENYELTFQVGRVAGRMLLTRSPYWG
jgi:hypothetical protein